jgi:hypothetical protein
MAKAKNTAIRASKHTLKFANKGKQEDVALFMSEYRKAVRFYVDWLWSADISWTFDCKNKTTGQTITVARRWCLADHCLDIPAMVSTTAVDIDSPLSARALKCASTQACGIVGAVVRKRVRDESSAAWQMRERGSVGKHLAKRLLAPIAKPNCSSVNAELNSICAEVSEDNGASFADSWLKLSSLFKPEVRGKGFSIEIPIFKHRQSLKWEKQGTRLNSFLLNERELQIRYEVAKPAEKAVGITVGVDQGKKTCLSFSDGQQSGTGPHGHTLESVIAAMCRKRKGSKGFTRAQEHRRNLVSYLVKNMNYTNVRQIYLEGVVNINFGRRMPKSMKHWTNTLIRDALEKCAWETGVQFAQTRSEYNSQRCSVCGWTRKRNRKAKQFACTACGNAMDADLNASKNVEIRVQLPNPPYWFRENRVNLRGFLWTLAGFFDSEGKELTVPCPAAS